MTYERHKPRPANKNYGAEHYFSAPISLPSFLCSHVSLPHIRYFREQNFVRCYVPILENPKEKISTCNLFLVTILGGSIVLWKGYFSASLKLLMKGSSSPFAAELSAALDGIESRLSWEMPLASGVLYSKSKEIEELGSYASFMLCNEFIENISDEDITDVSIEELSHNNCMKESDEVLQEVTNRILETLAERQSIASKDRKGEYGKRPDVMLIAKYKNKMHELIYAVCSRLVCTDTKKNDDWAKLWRELNDGMNWSKKCCKIIVINLEFWVSK
ncbi:hypothetical protein C2G38_2138590 [Gigaspora rosea]|uniref:Uncharacterized protein n=1 Tax=Gigaspora rosea TaxID=44941 RepID=A0A397VVR4_9GLOM|nr:hypothetical protein C2G38_2138590 [Gigaspora rosea]